MAAIDTTYVPAEGDPSSKIWFVGEAPGWEETQELRPFVGRAGQTLDVMLSNHGIARSDCFLTNLCHYRPAKNKFEILLKSPQLQEGLHELESLIETYNPNLIVPLGAWPLQYITGRTSISRHRGSILSLDARYGKRIKVVPTYHPSFVNRVLNVYPIFDLDFRRISEERLTPDFDYTERFIHIASRGGRLATLNGDTEEVEHHPFDYDYWYNQLVVNGITACDIESVKGTTEIICVGFGLSPSEGIVIPYDTVTNTTFIDRVLRDERINKIFHFGSYDVPVLRLNGHEVNCYTDDTEKQAHVLAPELPRDLATLVSLMTREPYFKSAGRSELPGDVKAWSKKRNKEDVFIYNGRDICTTIEVYYEQMKDLEEDGLVDFYRYEMELQQELLTLSDNGFARDSVRVDEIKKVLDTQAMQFWAMLYAVAGYKVRNVANKETCKLLYDHLGLPKRKKLNKKTGKQVLTTDEDAIVATITYIKNHMEKLKTNRKVEEWKRKFIICQLVLKIREVEKLLSSFINITEFQPGVVRCIYKQTTETGRLACSKYVDGSGLNMQTISRKALVA